MKRPSLDDYRAGAERLFTEEGRIEVDPGAKVSRGSDPGAYVQAWVWVPDEEAHG